MPDSAVMPGMQAGAGSPGAPPPQGTPSGEPQQAKGDIEQAKANVQIAITMLESMLPSFGSDTPEGQAVLKALSGLSKVFSGKKSEELVPAELMNIVQTMPDQYKQGLMQQQKPGAPGPGM